MTPPARYCALAMAEDIDLPPAPVQTSNTSLPVTGYRSTGQTDGHRTVTQTLTARSGHRQQ